MISRLLTALFLLTLTIFPTVVLAVDAEENKTCTAEVSRAQGGRLLEGICRECLDEGNCSLEDIKQVIENAGNFILYIVGSLVFLMYVLGGMCYLFSRGDPAWMTKAKNFFKFSTIGLAIVLAAYAGVRTLAAILRTGELPDSTEYLVCDGTDRTEGELCDLLSNCIGGQCVSKCEQSYPTTQYEGYAEQGICINIEGDQYAALKTVEEIEILGCTQNLCPGPSEVQCCQIRSGKKEE